LPNPFPLVFLVCFRLAAPQDPTISSIPAFGEVGPSAVANVTCVIVTRIM
jgi:hypothetical protein